MDGRVHPALAVVLLAVVLVLGLSGSVLVTEATEETFNPEFAALDVDDDHRLWLYTSTERSFETETLALNLVVHGDRDELRSVLLDDWDWAETDEEEPELKPDELADRFDDGFTDWDIAEGSDRYVYHVGPAGGAWLREAYQVHHGEYFGSRHHIRAYAPEVVDNWTALQAHHEHWDWFAAKHTVTSVTESQRFLENEFIESLGTRSVTRVHVGATDRADFAGWATIVDLDEALTPLAVLLAGLLVAPMQARRLRSPVSTLLSRDETQALAMALAIVAIVLAVRLGGILIERLVDPQAMTIAYSLYPALFVGLPVTAYVLARQLERPWAFAGAAGGFTLAVIADLAYLGVTHVPLELMTHRAGIAVALGLIAAGASTTERRDDATVDHIQFGVLLYLVAMVLPLLRHTPLPV